VVEERGEPLPVDLGGMPVVACDLHSQVACVAAAFAEAAPGKRLVYVMTDSAALPFALSDLASDLRGDGGLAASVSCGQAFGAEYEAVNVYSALQVAKAHASADAVVVAPGPGVVGTGTRLGFGGLEVAGVLVAAGQLGGQPIVAIRFSGSDDRERHQGVSHHTGTSLQLVEWPVVVPVPRDQPDPGPLRREHKILHVDVSPIEVGVTSMGRSQADDPEFVRYSAAAGVAAAQLLPD
jgi:hypothetical protein